MSVIGLREEIEQVADALLYDTMGPRAFKYVWELPKDASIDDYKHEITAWANRLYISNQIAYILTYSHRDDCDKSIIMMADEKSWKHGGHLVLDYPRFYRMLESIRYNLYSNGGQVVLSGPDMQKLSEIMAVIAREIVGDYQKLTEGRK
jgi:hypothetical protein